MTSSDSTVAALLTPLAPGGIAVIGVAGPSADAILSQILRHRDRQSPFRPADDRPIFCRLVDGEKVLDDAVIVRSVHGDRVTAEIGVHGGVRIAQRTLALVARQGAEIVDGLDFRRRLIGVDPIEEEVDRALLEAPARRLTLWLLSQRRNLPEYATKAGSLDSRELAAFRERSQIAIRLFMGLRVALIGPPNAGKSTLANHLIGMDRSIVSERPGTTRDWVSETALIQGWPVTLTDTAGIRETACPIEEEAIRRGSTQARQADVVVVVLDATAGHQEQQAHLDAATRLIPPEQPRIVALNKCGWAETTAPTPTRDWLSVSALTGEGMEVLESRLAALLGLDRLADDLPTAFRSDQLEAILSRSRAFIRPE